MVLGIIKLIGIVLFLYLTWRNLRDNYQEEKLVSYSWLALLFFLLGGRLVFGLINWGVWNNNLMDWLSFWQKPGFSYWGGMVTMFLATIWYCNVNDWKLWSFLEDMTGIIYTMVVLLMLDEWIRTGLDRRVGIYVLAAFLGWIINKLVAKRYRSFGWYKSGKKGFGWFFPNLIVFLFLALVGVFWFKDWLIAVIFGLFGLISLAGLFILGEVFISLKK